MHEVISRKQPVNPGTEGVTRIDREGDLLKPEIALQPNKPHFIKAALNRTKDILGMGNSHLQDKVVDIELNQQLAEIRKSLLSQSFSIPHSESKITTLAE